MAVWRLGALLHCDGLHLHPPQLPTGTCTQIHTHTHVEKINKDSGLEFIITNLITTTNTTEKLINMSKDISKFIGNIKYNFYNKAFLKKQVENVRLKNTQLKLVHNLKRTSNSL